MEKFDEIKLPDDAVLKTSWLYALSKKINLAPSLYLAAGAIHGCVLCEEDRPLIYMEDVGRHNAIDKIAGEAQGNAVSMQVIARDSENWAPQKRQDMTNARIRSIKDALVQRGIAGSRIRVTWTPSLSDSGITHDGAGYQIFAKLQIEKP